jgi:hypothetical protein
MVSDIHCLSLAHPSLANYPCFPYSKLVPMHNASLWFTHTLIFTKIHTQFNQVKKKNDTKYVNFNTYH